MRYYISDCHFFHEALNERMDRRGFASIEEMNDHMISKWNSKVRKRDEVVILGDFSFGKYDETADILKSLNGKKFLVQGNHDHYLWDKKFDRSLFEWIEPYKELSDNNRKVVLSHYPVFCYNGQYNKDKNGDPKSYMLYGHVHNTYDEKLVNEFINISRVAKRMTKDSVEPENVPCQMINCFCMFSDYQPLTLDEWIVVDQKRRSLMNNGESLVSNCGN